MAYMLKLPSFTDTRGRLTAVEILPFDIKRLYYICQITNESERGGHLHHLTTEAIFCVNGSFTVTVNNGKTREEFYLNDHTQCLIVEPYDWHIINNFSMGAILMGAASTLHDHSDYYNEEPKLPQ